jgi:hypothetical protein
VREHVSPASVISLFDGGDYQIGKNGSFGLVAGLRPIDAIADAAGSAVSAYWRFASDFEFCSFALSRASKWSMFHVAFRERRIFLSSARVLLRERPGEWDTDAH